MDSFWKHRYIIALVTAGTLFTLGTIVVANHAGISPVGTTDGLGITGIIQPTNPSLHLSGTPSPVRPAGVDVLFPKVISPTAAPPAPQTPPGDGFNWNSFVQLLMRASAQKGNTATKDNSTSDAYSFIPTGLISPPEQVAARTMTDSQKALFGWGSTVGEIILGYESSHPNQPAILTDYMQDRQNASKIAAMKKLGSDLQAVGENIDNSGDAPPQMATAAHALADAYREIGAKLSAIPDAKGDDATVKAIMTYDSSAEAFVKKYVNVVLIFQANAVTFTQDEPGGVFMFPSGN